MRSFPVLIVVVLACLAMIASAQASPAQLCVANMQLAGAENTDPAGRDLLMKFLAKEKGKSLAESIPINAAEPDKALVQAKAKNCDYLVTTNQTENNTENSQMPMMGTMSQVAMPTFYVTTTYMVTKVSDGSEVTKGEAKASDRGSEENALGFTMHKVADKVTQAIKKAGTAAK